MCDPRPPVWSSVCLLWPLFCVCVGPFHTDHLRRKGQEEGFRRACLIRNGDVSHSSHERAAIGSLGCSRYPALQLCCVNPGAQIYSSFLP